MQRLPDTGRTTAPARITTPATATATTPATVAATATAKVTARSGSGFDAEVLTGVDRWRAVLDDLDRTLSAALGTAEYLAPSDGPLSDAIGGELGPLPAELRPKAVELVARSEARMGEIRNEMARVADEITGLDRHARSSASGGWWSFPGGIDRSSSGMAQDL